MASRKTTPSTSKRRQPKVASSANPITSVGKLRPPSAPRPRSFSDDLMFLDDAELGASIVAEQQGHLFDEANPSYPPLALRWDDLTQRRASLDTAIDQLERQIAEMPEHIEIPQPQAKEDSHERS